MPASPLDPYIAEILAQTAQRGAPSASGLGFGGAPRLAGPFLPAAATGPLPQSAIAATRAAGAMPAMSPAAGLGGAAATGGVQAAGGAATAAQAAAGGSTLGPGATLYQRMYEIAGKQLPAQYGGAAAAAPEAAASAAPQGFRAAMGARVAGAGGYARAGAPAIAGYLASDLLVDPISAGVFGDESMGNKVARGATKGAGVGASIGSLFPGIGTGIGAAGGAVLGGVADPLASAFEQNTRADKAVGLIPRIDALSDKADAAGLTGKQRDNLFATFRDLAGNRMKNGAQDLTLQDGTKVSLESLLDQMEGQINNYATTGSLTGEAATGPVQMTPEDAIALQMAVGQFMQPYATQAMTQADTAASLYEGYAANTQGPMAQALNSQAATLRANAANQGMAYMQQSQMLPLMANLDAYRQYNAQQPQASTGGGLEAALAAAMAGQ